MRSSAEALGGIDIVIGNVSALAVSDDEDAWKAGFDTDIMHSVRLVNTAMPWLEKSKAPSITLISSVSGCRVAFKSETRRFRHRVLPLIARFGCHGAFASRPPLRNLINCGKQTWLLLESAQKSNLCIVVDAGA